MVERFTSGAILTPYVAFPTLASTLPPEERILKLIETPAQSARAFFQLHGFSDRRPGCPLQLFPKQVGRTGDNCEYPTTAERANNAESDRIPVLSHLPEGYEDHARRSTSYAP